MSESEFETELRALQPASPTAALEVAIGRELAETSRPLTQRPTSGLIVKPSRTGFADWWPRLAWAGAGAVAAVAVVTLSTIQRPPARSGGALPAAQVHLEEPTLFEPLESAREVIASEDAGVVYDDETGASQIVRYSSMERHSWTNAAGALVEVEVPREDLLIIPVSYQ
jgi:hypothetical protein